MRSASNPDVSDLPVQVNIVNPLNPTNVFSKSDYKQKAGAEALKAPQDTMKGFIWQRSWRTQVCFKRVHINVCSSLHFLICSSLPNCINSLLHQIIPSLCHHLITWSTHSLNSFPQHLITSQTHHFMSPVSHLLCESYSNNLKVSLSSVFFFNVYSTQTILKFYSNLLKNKLFLLCFCFWRSEDLFFLFVWSDFNFVIYFDMWNLCIPILIVVLFVNHFEHCLNKGYKSIDVTDLQSGGCIITRL